MRFSDSNWKCQELPVIVKALPDDWVAECGVCGGRFAIRAADSSENPSPTGSFCLDCRENRLVAPGVLNWRRRQDRLADL